MTAQPTGRLDPEGHLVLSRTLQAPLEEVWAAVTDPRRLGRWYGPWSGDPSSGRVEVLMTAEGADQPEPVLLRRCEPPRHLAVTLGTTADAWRVDLDLEDGDGSTVLRLTHRYPAAGELDSVGPGWEYYLDRLVAAESGRDPDELDFARDYHPAMAGHYRALADALHSRG
ncbi:SRPBCC domain-containing protein [Kocuria turfanensis]|uniref:SRPBCC domain-containing protein n=1 Tax=Kocuria turfanensis TaxID=388357 RepID=UPI0040365B89